MNTNEAQDPVIDSKAFDPKIYNPGSFSVTPDPADANLLVKFFMKTKENGYDKDGVPQFREVEYVDIRVPGKQDPVVKPVDFRIKQRFPQHYAAFKNRTAAPSQGFPLKEWAVIPRTLVEQMAFFNVKTVEQLASISDVNAAKIRGATKYKLAAQQFLESNKENGQYMKMAELLKERDDVIEAQEERIADLERKIQAIMSGSTDLTPVDEDLNPVKAGTLTAPAPEVKEAPVDVPDVDNTPPAPSRRRKANPKK